MPTYVYDRSAVPVGSQIDLETQFRDSAGNAKDTDAYPTVRIEDADNVVVRSASNASVARVGLGLYRLRFEIPDGYEPGVWNDEWIGAVDGYSVRATFAFTVDSIGTIEAVGTVVAPVLELGDDPDFTYTQAEILGINVLLKGLKARLRNTAISPDGTPCPVVPDAELIDYLRMSLSEFNVMPTITYYLFSDELVYGLFSDVIIEGAFLQALSAVAILSAGQEFTVVDSGVSIQPPNVSGTINTVITSRQSLYLEKLKGLKRGIKPSPRGFGSGSLLVPNVKTRAQRHRREGSIL